MVRPSTTSARIISGRSVIAAAGSSAAITSSRSSSSAPRVAPNHSHRIARKTAMITTTTGARLTRKSPKSSPAAEPIRMFGGSPMSVAVPPMFDAKIWLIRYGNGETLERSRDRQGDRRQQDDRRHVVEDGREQRRDDREDHEQPERLRRATDGWPARRDVLEEAGLARPPARIIIPASRKMTLKSIAANASSWSMIPRTTTSRPPSMRDEGPIEALEAIRA